MSGDLTEQEARSIIGVAKFIPEDSITWEESPQHSAYHVAKGTLVDRDGVSIPGLTVELAVRSPPSWEECKYTFTIFSFSPGGRRRAYQLEVVPDDIRSHVGELHVCFGPHEHIGTTVHEVRIDKLTCKDHEKWFRVFCERTNISFGGMYTGPFDGRLFGI